MRIAILYNKGEKLHSTNWSTAWVTYCKNHNLDYEIVNPYEYGVISHLMEFEIVLWHFSNYSFKDMLMARNILFTLEGRGKIVFPSLKDSWHFDDKLAETYLLESVDAPIPQCFYYFDFISLKADVEEGKIPFPIVAKLRNGSGSHNVKLLRSENELTRYGKKMFSSGINSAPSLLYKATSNIKTARNLKTVLKRAKRIPEFLRSLNNARKFNVEKGYVYLQKLIPNEGFDLKIVVIGDKLSYIGRKIRKGEFRASGGGDLFYNKEIINKDIIDSAFTINDRLGFSCMGYDYIIDSESGKGIIVEISYGFSYQALGDAGGYFDREGVWHYDSFLAPDEVLKNIVNRIR